MPLPSVPVSEPLPADAISSVAAFGLSKLRSAYAGPLVRVRESGGNTLLDINADTDGNLDQAALLAHVGANDGYVETWYDQVGSANLTQATTGSQPLLVQAGQILVTGTEPHVIFSGLKNLTGTMGAAIASNNCSVFAVMRDASSTHAADRFDWFALRSGTSNCLLLRTGSQSLYSSSYATPGGSSYQTGDNPDYPMTWSRFAIVGITSDTDLKHWRDNLLIGTWTPTQTGASGTGLWLGCGNALYATAIRELFVFNSSLSQSQIDTLYDSINERHVIGPQRAMPTIALEERYPWDTVLRKWIADLTTDDLDVTVGTFTWDDTYANTDELLRIYLQAFGGYSNTYDFAEGLHADSKWWRLKAVNECGIESDYPLYSVNIASPGILRQFTVGPSANVGFVAALWANWYAFDLPKAAGAQGNPYYQQRGVAVRALVDAIITCIQKNKQADQSTYEQSLDIFGGMLNMVSWVFKQCRDELPLHVQEAYLQMLRFSATRCSYSGARSVNSNMDCKGLQALATIYSIVPDAATKQVCLEHFKLALFGSKTGTPDTTALPGIYSPAGSILEGQIGAGSEETTYNGHSLYHLVGGLTHVYGDPSWSFFETIVDRLAKLKIFQYVIQPDGSIDGPGGYGGRTGGCRVLDQGFEVETNKCISAFSQYGRQLDKTLPDAAGMVTAINAQLATLNARLGYSMEILSGNGLHTKGVDCFVRECTVELDPANTLTKVGHGLPNGTAIYLSVVSGGILPTELVVGTVHYVVNATADTFQLALTEGGAAITFTGYGTGTPKNARCYPLAYFTDTPNLAYTKRASCEAFIKATVGGQDYYGQIIYTDNTLKRIAIYGHLTIPEASPVAYTIENGPQRWVSPSQHWPVQGAYFPPAGYYDAQRARIVANDDTLKSPWELPTAFSEWFGDRFWARKATNASSREYGWIVECIDDTGSYDGWYGGKLEEFWTKDSGTVIRCRHDKSGNQVNQDENTRVWAERNIWATTHIWGTDSIDKGFSSAATTPVYTRTLDKTGPPVYVQISGTHTTGAKESGSALTGSWTVTNRFEETTGGLEVTNTVTYTGSDTIKELWATIPVFLRYADQGSLADTTIQFWTGASWTTVTTSIANTTAIRLGRNHGSGTKYVWITFGSSTPVRLSPSVWLESEMDNGRYRNINVDLLGYTGSAQAWPASASTTFTVTSVDPGLTATEPSISITYPDTNRILPVDGRWMVKGDVEWLASAGTVTAEYSTDGTNWLSIGSMTNTTGNTWEYTGGTIPASVVKVRLRATPPTGNEGSLAVDVTSAAYSLVVEDNFTSADGTAINASWTSWTTNTTGNSYQILNSTGVDVVRVNTNQAGHNEAASVINSRTIGIDVGNTDSVVEGVLKMGTSNTQALPGVCSRVVSGYANGFRCAVGLSSSFNLEFRPSYNSGATPELSLTIPSYSNNNEYRLVLQTVGDAACASVYDGVTLVGTLYKFGLFNTSNTRVGFTAPAIAGSAYIDAFKVYTP